MLGVESRELLALGIVELGGWGSVKVWDGRVGLSLIHVDMIWVLLYLLIWARNSRMLV